jgi:hypothetical protein
MREWRARESQERQSERKAAGLESERKGELVSLLYAAIEQSAADGCAPAQHILEMSKVPSRLSRETLMLRALRHYFQEEGLHSLAERRPELAQYFGRTRPTD